MLSTSAWRRPHLACCSWSLRRGDRKDSRRHLERHFQGNEATSTRKWKTEKALLSAVLQQFNMTQIKENLQAILENRLIKSWLPDGLLVTVSKERLLSMLRHALPPCSWSHIWCMHFTPTQKCGSHLNQCVPLSPSLMVSCATGRNYREPIQKPWFYGPVFYYCL